MAIFNSHVSLPEGIIIYLLILYRRRPLISKLYNGKCLNQPALVVKNMGIHWVNQCMHAGMDGWMDGWIDGWMEA